VGPHRQGCRCSSPDHVNGKIIRLKMPLPVDPLLHQVAIEAGLIGPNMIGMTLGHGIFIAMYDVRILSHECRHVCQYEQAGPIEAFLSTFCAAISH
jgi:hypothetical protein